jgi:Ser/Thr protein kinase RdoA (MazF antagonist)
LRDGERLAAEFGLGRLLAARPLAGGGPGVLKLTTEQGEFVVKPGARLAHAQVHEHAALALSRAGIRQARLLRTTTGALIAASGHSAQEFLPGRICLHPTPAQTAAVMRHAGAYHAALASVPAPPALRAEQTLWTRVTRPDYLIEALPGLLRRSGLPGVGDDSARRAVGYLEAALPQLRRLPPQVVHGDIGPDNVLMRGDEVVAVIDFTPFAEPALFAVATAVYWYHLHGRPAADTTADTAAIAVSLAAAAPGRPWTAAELAAWPAMLLRESLRRLATPLALAEEAGTAVPAGVGLRYEAVRTVVRSWRRLA